MESVGCPLETVVEAYLVEFKIFSKRSAWKYGCVGMSAEDACSSPEVRGGDSITEDNRRQRLEEKFRNSSLA